MSRIEEYEPESVADDLRMWAFTGNIRRAVAGKRGREFLLELEAALLALPEKRLASGVMAASQEEWIPGREIVPTGDVCALGAVAAARAVKAGRPRPEALHDLARDFDPERSGWELTRAAAEHLGICHPLAWAVVYRNDECNARTPEERYEKVLAWARAKLAGEPER